jgi:uncharacterized membrane protein
LEGFDAAANAPRDRARAMRRQVLLSMTQDGWNMRFLPENRSTPIWMIPMYYVGGAVATGLVLPRLEQAYFPHLVVDISVSSAQAYLSAASSGMMALSGIVFAMAFVMVQFSAIAYSPRLVLWFARDPILFHALGVFAGTFIYSLFTLCWVDRGGAGAVPALSALLVGVFIIASMFLFARLIQRLNDLQISNVLRLIGDRGRAVIHEMFPLDGAGLPSSGAADRIEESSLGPISQVIAYSGPPRSVASFELAELPRMADRCGGALALACAVGDTVVEGDPLLRVHGGRSRLPDEAASKCIRLSADRTFEQDPKYPIRLLVDIAIRALSPAINDPTTAVQTLDQIEDLLRRLAQRNLDAGAIRDGAGAIRVIIPQPSWEDYLDLAFDEIRQYGVGSVQVIRRMRSALKGLAETSMPPDRAAAVERYLLHLDKAMESSPLDAEDRLLAGKTDRQGLGLSRQ